MADHCAVEFGGVRLAYRLWGSAAAPPLVLLHALGEGAADWGGVAPAFARHWRVYAPDLRGHRSSSWPGSYSVEAMEADVLGFLDTLALDQVDRVAELARRIPGARHETIPAGHLIHAAEPEAFTKTALTFLQPGKATDRLHG